jgi:hypothetical protein
MSNNNFARFSKIIFIIMLVGVILSLLGMANLSTVKAQKFETQLPTYSSTRQVPPTPTHAISTIPTLGSTHKVVPTPTMIITTAPTAMPISSSTSQPNELGPTPTPDLNLKRIMDENSSEIIALSGPPSNDDVDTSTQISVFPFSDGEDTTGATVAPDDPNMGCGAGVNSNTVWYRFLATEDGHIRANTFGSSYDTVLASFTGSRGLLSGVTCNDDYSSLQSQIEFSVTSGEAYYLEVADYGSPGGGFLQLTVVFTPTPKITVPLDIIFVQDETGSMGDDISSLQILAPQIWDSIYVVSEAGFRMGVVGFRDYSQNNWGCSGDWVYRLLSDFTTNRDQFVSAINTLTANNGCDGPEAQYAALDYLLTPRHACIDSDGNGSCLDSFDTPSGQEPNFRSGAKRVILLATDSSFHDPDNTPGYPGPTRNTVTSELTANRAIVIGLVPGGAGFLPQMDDLTAITGGSTQSTGSSGQDVAAAIATALGQIYPVSPDLSIVISNMSSIPADGTSTATITVTLKDTSNHPVAGKTIMLLSNRGGNDMIIQPATVTDVNGRTSGLVSSMLAGTGVISAVDVTDNVYITQSASVQFISVSTDLTHQIYTLDNVSHQQLQSLATIAKDIGANGDYFRGAIAADEANTAMDAFTMFSGTIEGVDQIDRLQGGLDLALPGVRDGGYGPIKAFINSYPEAGGDLFDVSWENAVQSNSLKGLTKPILDVGGKYFAAKILDDSMKEITQDLFIQGWQKIVQSSGGFTWAGNALANDTTTLGLSLTSQTNTLVANIPYMSDVQRSAYVIDLKNRVGVPYVLTNVAKQQADMIDNIRSAQESVGGNGVMHFILKFAADFLATATFNGPGHIIVNGITSAFDLYVDSCKLGAAQQAFDQAPSALEASTNAAINIFNNETYGFNRVTRLQSSKVLSGLILNISHYSVGNNIGPFWFEHYSYSDVEIKNTSNNRGTFEVFAQYGYNSTIFGLPWAYMPMVNSDTIVLDPNQSGTVRIYYKQDEKGGSPETNSVMGFDVLASNESGSFYIDHQQEFWTPLHGIASATSVEMQMAGDDALIPFTPATDGMTTIENPIDEYVTSDSSDQTFHAQIWISNPFSQTIDVTITQSLPGEVNILTTDGTINNSTITWQISVAASDMVSVTFSYRYPSTPGAMLSLPSSNLSFTEPTSGEPITTQSNSPTFIGLSTVAVEGYTPIGTNGFQTSMPIKVTNLIADNTNGSIIVEIKNAVDTQVYSNTIPFSLSGFGNQTLKFEIPSLPEGFYTLDSYLVIGETTLKTFRDTYRIYSPVNVSGNVGISGVTLTYDAGGYSLTALSDNVGNYKLLVPFGWSGSVVPSVICNIGEKCYYGRNNLMRYYFEPTSRIYENVTANQNIQNFILRRVY